MNKFIRTNAPAMYQQSTSILQNYFLQTIKKVPADLKKAPITVIEDARRIFKLLLDNHTEGSFSRSKQDTLSQKKQKMREEVSTELDKIVRLWHQDIQPPTEERNDPLETYILTAEELAKIDLDDSDDDTWLEEDGDAMDMD